MRNVPPHREPGRRPPPPEGVLLRGRRERTKKRAPAEQRAPREPEDHVISRISRRHEDAYLLQRQAELAWDTAEAQGNQPLFGVSGWIVAAPAEPFPPGFARLSRLASFGFRVVATPHLGRRGHVTILLEDPVDEGQAARFNEAFGRTPEEDE